MFNLIDGCVPTGSVVYTIFTERTYDVNYGDKVVILRRVNNPRFPVRVKCCKNDNILYMAEKTLAGSLNREWKISNGTARTGDTVYSNFYKTDPSVLFGETFKIVGPATGTQFPIKCVNKKGEYINMRTDVLLTNPPKRKFRIKDNVEVSVADTVYTCFSDRPCDVKYAEKVKIRSISTGSKFPVQFETDRGRIISTTQNRLSKTKPVCSWRV
eukprot:UN33672